MSDFNRGYPRAATAPVADMSVDAGLRGFMLGVYNKVALGLLVSAAMAFLTSSVPQVRDLMFHVNFDGRVSLSALGAVVAWAPLAILLITGFTRTGATPQASGLVYWSIVTLIGASMGLLALIYSGQSIATTFLITAAAFAGLSVVGYTTKRDLTGFGSFLIMGLIGLILASVINVFLQSSMMQFLISVVGVLIFAGLIAYDTQRLKLTYHQLGGDQAAMSVATSYGALSLYLDFINLFRFLLYFMGGARR